MKRLAHLRRRSLFGLGVFLFLTRCFAAQTPAAPQTPNIRISVERVSVGVTVTDSHGQFLTGLQRNNFLLFDNGVAQPITDFLSIDEPAQVLLLVEAGPAVYLLQEGHLQAVKVLLEGLAPADRVAIARYDQNAEPILNFISDKPLAAGAIDQLRFNVGFGQLNLATSLSTALDWLAGVPGKKSVVLLSTGVDTSPPDKLNTLLDRLKTTDVHVLPVSLSGDLADLANPPSKNSKKAPPVDPQRQAAAQGIARASSELNIIAAANGSRAYFPQTTREFTQVFSEISQLIRHEYSLGFSPPAHDGKVHSITVRLANPPAQTSAASSAGSEPRVDCRKAYVAPLADNP